MASSPEPLLTPTTLLSALGAAVAIILSLVGVLYNKLTTTDSDQQGQLDEGADHFTENAVHIAKIQKDIDAVNTAIKNLNDGLTAFVNASNGLLKSDIEAIRKWVKSIEKDFDELSIKSMQDHDTLTNIHADHKNFHGSKK